VIVLVGEAPSQHSNPKKPFSGASGKTLAKVAGLSGYEELRARATLLNVLDRWPGKGNAGEKGSRFPLVRAKPHAAKILARFLYREGASIVLVGKRVARAFGFDEVPPFRWAMSVKIAGVDLGRVAVMPHPSGCNHWWNAEENRAAASAFLRGVFDEDLAAKLHVADRLAGLIPVRELVALSGFVPVKTLWPVVVAPS
jgi:uracil-DNA glycosylase